MILPPLQSGILAGITRHILIDRVAPIAGVQVREEVVRPEDLTGMSECFLTATTKDLIPVQAIDRVIFTVGFDTITMRLKRAFSNYVDTYIKAHPHQSI